VRLWYAAWASRHVAAQFAQAIELGERLRTEAARAGDELLAAAGSVCAGSSMTHVGRAGEALARFEAAYEVFARHPDESGPSPSHMAVDIRSYGCVIRALNGDVEGARTWAAEAVAIADDLDWPFSRCIAQFFAGWAASLLGDVEAAARYTEEGLAVTTAHRFEEMRGMTQVIHAWATARLGDPHGQPERIREGLAVLNRSGSHNVECMWLAMLADTLLDLGDPRGAADTLDAARAAEVAHGETAFRPWIAGVERRLADATEAAEGPGA
jgi:hypothetical protein